MLYVFILALALLAGGCGVGDPFTSGCYKNADSGERLLCLEKDGTYHIDFDGDGSSTTTNDEAQELGHWSAGKSSVTLTRSDYSVPRSAVGCTSSTPDSSCGNELSGLSDSYSCDYSFSGTTLKLTCNGSSKSVKAANGTSTPTTLTPDGQELDFNAW